MIELHQNYPTHFLTRHGPLCGTLRARSGTLIATQTVCWACRALLEAGIKERRAQVAAPLGVIPTPRIWGG